MGKEHDHDEQHHAVDPLLHARDLPAHRGEELGDAVGEEGEHRRAEDRAEEGAEAADDRAEDDLDRAADVEDLLGEEVVVVEGEEHARHRGHRRGERHRVHLPAESVDPQSLRRFLVFADRLPVVPGFRFQQEIAKDERETREREHRVEYMSGGPRKLAMSQVSRCATRRNMPPGPPTQSRWSKPMRVNSAKAMVRSAKYTPEMPKRKARKPIATPSATQSSIATHSPAHGPIP